MHESNQSIPTHLGQMGPCLPCHVGWVVQVVDAHHLGQMTQGGRSGSTRESRRYKRLEASLIGMRHLGGGTPISKCKSQSRIQHHTCAGAKP